MKVVYTRMQMFTGHGYRPYTIQKIALEPSGKLSAMIHEVVHHTSAFEEFSGDTTRFTPQVYACPNLDAPEAPQARAPLDAGWALAGRLGDGHRRLGRGSDARQRQNHVADRRIRARRQRDQRHRPGDVYGDDDDRCRVSRAEAGAGDVRRFSTTRSRTFASTPYARGSSTPG